MSDLYEYVLKHISERYSRSEDFLEDASELTEHAQKMMFLGNVRYHPKASFKGLSIDTLPDWWADYHWAGDDSHREGHIESFIHSMEHYKS
jgi:hypothetical protein